MDVAAFADGALCGHECLADHLSAKDPLPADLRAHSAVEVVLQLLEIERFQ